MEGDFTPFCKKSFLYSLRESFSESTRREKELLKAFRECVIDDVETARLAKLAVKRDARIERRAARRAAQRAAALFSYRQLLLLPLPMPDCDDLPEFLR